MTDNCHPAYHDLGTHAPGCPSSTPASVAVSSAWEPDAGVSTSLAPRAAAGDASTPPTSVGASPIFVSRPAAAWSLAAALVVFAAAAGLVWGVAVR